MDKRYQVFISSTFVDLVDERQGVLRAILELDQMPAGMELFPAGDESAWELITDVIDSSDYYVLIIGGRYGSLDENGISYTEKEYDYAVAQQKPVIPLLHENPDNLPRGKTETDESAWNRLTAFRTKVERAHTCSSWTSADQLQSKVITGLTNAMKRKPMIGWVRADEIPSEATIAEVLELRDRIIELESEAASARSEPPAGTEELAQGEDTYEVQVEATAYSADVNDLDYDGVPVSTGVRATWSEIFGAAAPTMINEAPESDVRQAISRFFESVATATLAGDDRLDGKELQDFEIANDVMDTVIVQLRALKLVRESDRTRSLRDTQTYWALTPYGDELMTRIRAIRRG